MRTTSPETLKRYKVALARRLASQPPEWSVSTRKSDLILFLRELAVADERRLEQETRLALQRARERDMLRYRQAVDRHEARLRQRTLDILGLDIVKI